MRKAKLIGSIILILLIVIVVLQNTQSVETKILFFTITMPRALLLIASAAIGFVLGLLSSLRISRK